MSHGMLGYLCWRVAMNEKIERKGNPYTCWKYLPFRTGNFEKLREHFKNQDCLFGVLYRVIQCRHCC